MVVTILRKSESATGLVLKRNSGCLKKYGGGSSFLPRICGSVAHRLGLGENGSSLPAQGEGPEERRGLTA